MNKLELYGIGLLIFIAVVVGAEFHGRHVGREATEEKFAAAAEKQAEQSREHEHEERDRLLSVSTNYEQQISQIKVDAASRPARIVRLCDSETTATVSTNTTAAGGLESSATIKSSGANGRDIGPELYNYADDFKACAVQVNALLDAWPR